MKTAASSTEHAHRVKATKPDPEMARVEPVLGDAPDTKPTLVLPVEITHAQAAGCLHMLLIAVRAEKRDFITLMVDAAPLTRFDSSALAVLIECRREVLKTGRGFAVRGMPARLAELARLYGVAELLDAPKTSA